MKAKLIFLLKYYLFWVGLSVVAKVIFLFYQWQDTETLEGGDVWHIIVRGLQLDFSLGGYIMMFSALILACSPFLKQRVVRMAFSVLTVLCLVFFSVVMTIDLELFKNWGYHIDTTPLMYLKTPGEAMASTPVWLICCLILFASAFCVGAWCFFKRLLLSGLKYSPGQYWSIPVFLLIGGGMIIPVRGGFNVAPMNSSFVFFHPENMYANQAAINPVWNFVYELMHIKKTGQSYSFMPTEKAERLIREAEQTEGEFPELLRMKRPNIVFLLLESFTANAIEVLGGLPDVTPNLNALAKEGVLFSNIYATGSRSDRGMVAAISGLPSNPSLALIKYPNKIVQYPRFPKDLEGVGYTTRYYYAGDINFGSFRSYVTMSFQSVVTEDDFSGAAIENRFKWGVHDEYMFERLYADLTVAPQPFMYMAFNMSSHEPFTVPGEKVFSGDDSEHLFMNAIHYSDRCIGDFIRKCKESGIWDSTLFILMADHGTRVIKHIDPNLPAAYHIPLLLAGGALNIQDTVIHTIGSQTDMIATVLAQLGMDYSGYKYSRNLLAVSAQPFAFYSYPNAAAIVSDKGVSIFNLQNKQFVAGDSIQENTTLLKAYLQSITTELGNTFKPDKQ